MNYITCPNCSQQIPVQTEMKKADKPLPRKIKFFYNGTQAEAMAVPYDHAFYSIVGGKWNGNLVHIFDLIK